jgi:hypothetical protein
MKTTSLACLIVLLFLATAPIFAAEQGANYGRLKHLEQMIGHWKYVGEDAEGRTVHGSETNSWAQNKNYVRVEGIWQPEGVAPITYELIIGWDAELKKEVLNGILSTGATYRREGHHDEGSNTTVSAQSSVTPDGSKATSICTVKHGADSWSATWTDARQDGEPIGDAHIKAVRIPENFNLPEDVMEEFEHTVGIWKLTGQASKGKLEGMWSVSWAPGKHCLISDYSLSIGDTCSRSSELYAWDSIAKEFVLYSVYQGGHIEVCRTKLVEPGVLQGPYRVDIDGKRYEATIEIRRTSDDELTVSTSGLADQGIDELKLRGVRIKTDNGKSLATTPSG